MLKIQKATGFCPLIWYNYVNIMNLGGHHGEKHLIFR